MDLVCQTSKRKMAAAAEVQLIAAIKTLIAKGDKAAEKAEQFYIAAGQHLKTLKEQKPCDVTWEHYVTEKVGLGRSRADELIRIADGRTSIAQVREQTAKRVSQHRARPALRNGGPEPEGVIVGNDVEPEATAAARKREAAAEDEAAIEILMPIGPEISTTHGDTNIADPKITGEAVRIAKERLREAMRLAITTYYEETGRPNRKGYHPHKFINEIIRTAEEEAKAFMKSERPMRRRNAEAAT
jgi:hypothetical protein